MKNADFRGFVSKSSQNYNFFRASITFENQLVVDELDRVVISKAKKSLISILESNFLEV